MSGTRKVFYTGEVRFFVAEYFVNFPVQTGNFLTCPFQTCGYGEIQIQKCACLYGPSMEERNPFQNHFQMNLLIPLNQDNNNSNCTQQSQEVDASAHLLSYFPETQPQEEIPNYNDDDFENDTNEDKTQKLTDDINRMKVLLNSFINNRVQWMKPIR